MKKYVPYFGIITLSLFFINFDAHANDTYATPEIIIGALEDVPGAYADQPNFNAVRVLFRKTRQDWQAFPHDCENADCLQTVASQYPATMTWNIFFNGRDLGQVTSDAPKQFDFYYQIGLEEITANAKVPTVGKKSIAYGGDLGVRVYRPLVANSQSYYADPDEWKPAEISDDILKLLQKEFRHKFAKVENCISGSDTENYKPWKYTDKNIQMIKAYASKDQWIVAEIQLNGYNCDGPSDEAFLNQWFAISPVGKIQHLGQGMWLVDAGDYDNDGKSELVFALNSDNKGGYKLFYNNFEKHADFTFSYH